MIDNKKGQENGSTIGYVITAAIAVLIGLALVVGSLAPDIGKMTSTYKVENYTVTLGNAGTYVDLKGQEYIGSLFIYNDTGTGIVVVDSTNFTVQEAVSSTTGYKRIQITPVPKSAYNGSLINVSYIAGLEGYVDDAGARSIVGLIIVFACLLIAVSAMPNVREGIMDFVKGNR